MSQVRVTGNVSGTGTFTITSPNSNNNQTFTLPDVTGTLVTNTAGSVTQTMLATEVVPVGVGQTWQNVLGSRASGTTYTNSTGRPIFVCVNASQWFSSVVVSGVSVAVTGSSNSVTASFVVPSGGTYSATVGAGSINVWAELR